MNQNDKERISRVEDTLYSRAHPSQYRDDRAELGKHDIAVDESWKGTERVEDLIMKSRQEKVYAQNRLVRKILWGSIGFFVIALGVGLFTFFGGLNMVSSNNIDIIVSGPTTVAGGAELPLEITIQNKNNANLEGAVLTVEYPEGTKTVGDLTTALPRQSITIGGISSRGQAHETLKAVLFGEKDSVKNIKITLQYKVQGTTALFSKEKNYDIGISSSPIIVTTEYPTEINSNQDFTLVIHLASNTTELLKNVLVQAQYPFGFTFVSSDPKPSIDTNTWNLGDFDIADKRTITIHGTLQGQDKEQRTFQLNAGVGDVTNPNKLATTLTTLQSLVTIKKSAADFAMDIAQSGSSVYTVNQGKSVPVKISWANNLPNQIVNAVIQVKLSGTALNRDMVIANNGGYYRSLDNSIIWDSTSNPNFEALDPGKRGTVSFSLVPLATFPASARNQDITLSATFNGNQIIRGNIPQAVTSKAAGTIKIATQLGLTTRSVRSVGPFENMGPIPPIADQPTTYTIVWTANNSLNEVNNMKVTTTLPQYVTWNNITSPSNERLTFDQVSKTVTWNVGTINAGSGFDSSPREVAFQVTMIPSLGQFGGTPPLTGDTLVTASDAFTGSLISFSRQPLTIRTITDPQFKEGDDRVVK